MFRLSEAAERIRERERIKTNARLKANGGADLNEYELDMLIFKYIPFGHSLRHEFFLRCGWHQWGNDFMLEAEGVENYWATRMAKAFCRERRLNLMGCGSSGKTALASAYVYTAWKSRPFNTSVFLSTTSGEAAQARTWGQVKDWHANDKYRIGKRIESLHLITLDEEATDEDGNKSRDFRNSIKVVLIKPGSEGKNVMASIVGRKNDAVIWCCDEFPFMDIGILNARVNLNTNPFNQFIGLGNAPEEGDPMYLDAAPFGDEFPDGWRSIDKSIHKTWPTEKGRCFYFNGDDSPNFKTKSGMGFPKLMNERFRLEILKDSGGEDTPMYYKQYYGFPPTVDVPDKIITHKLLESNGCYETPLWLDAQQKIGAGLDLGFREGGDPCVLDFFRIGKDVRGRTVACWERDGIVLNPSQGSKDAFEVQIAKKVIQECRSRDCHDLSLDVTGDGGMILQAIERQAREQGYKLDVFPVSFSGTAEARVVIPGDKRRGDEMFANMVSQLWSTFRISCLNRVIYGCNPHSKAVIQLCSRKFVTDDRKRFLVEKKSEMKKRLKRSPDHADARCVAHHLALKMGLSGMQAVVTPKTQEKREESAPAVQRYVGHGSTSLYGRR